ncbi:hypothetical protein DFJ73DRAFT_933832, partial [Zopfochytrium polystomum]
MTMLGMKVGGGVAKAAETVEHTFIVGGGVANVAKDAAQGVAKAAETVGGGVANVAKDAAQGVAKARNNATTKCIPPFNQVEKTTVDVAKDAGKGIVTAAKAIAKGAPQGFENSRNCDTSHQGNQGAVKPPSMRKNMRKGRVSGKRDLKNLQTVANVVPNPGSLSSPSFTVLSTINTQSAKPLAPASQRFKAALQSQRNSKGRERRKWRPEETCNGRKDIKGVVSAAKEAKQGVQAARSLPTLIKQAAKAPTAGQTVSKAAVAKAGAKVVGREVQHAVDSSGSGNPGAASQAGKAASAVVEKVLGGGKGGDAGSGPRGVAPGPTAKGGPRSTGPGGVQTAKSAPPGKGRGSPAATAPGTGTTAKAAGTTGKGRGGGAPETTGRGINGGGAKTPTPGMGKGGGKGSSATSSPQNTSPGKGRGGRRSSGNNRARINGGGAKTPTPGVGKGGGKGSPATSSPQKASAAAKTPGGAPGPRTAAKGGTVGSKVSDAMSKITSAVNNKLGGGAGGKGTTAGGGTTKTLTRGVLNVAKSVAKNPTVAKAATSLAGHAARELVNNHLGETG